MRKIYVLLAVILLICMIPIPAHAAGFSIDDQHIFEGMDRTYREGYVPLVQNGTATIVLPLVADGDIGDTITATPNLGEPETSPFVFRNYQKTAHRARYEFESGRANAYLIRFDLLLSSDRVNGVYPVTIDVKGKDGSGGGIQQSFTSYVTITDGKESSESESRPKIIVGSYSIEPSPVMAGDTFTAKITLTDTSKSEPVANMIVTASCDSPHIALQNESNALFVGSLGKGKSTEVELSYKTDLDTPPQRYNISLSIEYENAEAATFSATGSVPVAVSQPLRVEIEMPKIAREVNAGDTLPLSFQVMNLGRSMVYNVRCEVSGEGLFPTGTAFIGNMEAGTDAAGDMDVFIGTKDMTEGYTGEDKYGATSGMVTLIYEDADGQEYREETEFYTTINPPLIQTNTEPEEEPDKAGQWWVAILIGGAVIAGLAAYLTRRNRRARENEDI